MSETAATTHTSGWRHCRLCHGVETPERPMKKCSRCDKVGMLVMFCSQECQRKAWKQHKQHCGVQMSSPPGYYEKEYDDADRRLASRHIEIWQTVHIRLIEWAMHQHWTALKQARDEKMFHVHGHFVEVPEADQRIPKLHLHRLGYLSRAHVAKLLENANMQDQVPDGEAFSIRVGPVIGFKPTSIIAVSCIIQATTPVLYPPCPNWSFVFQSVVETQAQSPEECNMTLKAEMMRRQTWEAFLGEGSQWRSRRMPVLEPLDTDASWWRDTNWIDHPQFVAWYKKRFGSHPVDALAAMTTDNILREDQPRIQRLRKWVAMSALVRRKALPRVPVTEESWKERPGCIGDSERMFAKI